MRCARASEAKPTADATSTICNSARPRCAITMHPPPPKEMHVPGQWHGNCSQSSLRQPGAIHGEEESQEGAPSEAVRSQGVAEGRESHARDETRPAPFRPLRQEGDEPKAGGR